MRSPTHAILLRGEHLDELSAPGHDRAQHLGLLIEQRTREGAHHLGKVSQELRIKGIGFGEFPGRLGEVPLNWFYANYLVFFTTKIPSRIVTRTAETFGLVEITWLSS